MMGLEALFLDDDKELSFKLATRVSKIMSFLNHDPFAVRDSMKIAYSIRSTFAHGSLLSSREKRRLEMRYGDLNRIFRVTLDYLRLGILAAFLLPIGKEDMIDLTDDALIDTRQSTELEGRLSAVRSFL